MKRVQKHFLRTIFISLIITIFGAIMGCYSETVEHASVKETAEPATAMTTKPPISVQYPLLKERNIRATQVLRNDDLTPGADDLSFMIAAEYAVIHYEDETGDKLEGLQANVLYDRIDDATYAYQVEFCTDAKDIIAIILVNANTGDKIIK